MYFISDRLHFVASERGIHVGLAEEYAAFSHFQIWNNSAGLPFRHTPAGYMIVSRQLILPAKYVAASVLQFVVFFAHVLLRFHVYGCKHMSYHAQRKRPHRGCGTTISTCCRTPQKSFPFAAQHVHPTSLGSRTRSHSPRSVQRFLQNVSGASFYRP